MPAENWEKSAVFCRPGGKMHVIALWFRFLVFKIGRLWQIRYNNGARKTKRQKVIKMNDWDLREGGRKGVESWSASLLTFFYDWSVALLCADFIYFFARRRGRRKMQKSRRRMVVKTMKWRLVSVFFSLSYLTQFYFFRGNKLELEVQIVTMQKDVCANTPNVILTHACM